MSRPTWVRWRILTLLSAAAFASYFLRINTSVAAEPIMRDLGFTELQFGLILAAAAWGYALFQLPGGVLGDLIGPRRTLTLIMVLWGVMTILTGLVPGSTLVPASLSLAYLVIVRFLLGAVSAPIFPVSSGGTIATWFPKSGWALPNGLTSTGLTIGAALTGPVIPWLTSLYGWRHALLITSPMAFVLAALWWWYSRDRPRDHPAINAAEVALIEANRPPEPPAMPMKSVLRLVLANADILRLTASYFCMNYVFYLFFNWFYYYLTHVRHFDEQQSGYFNAVQWITGAVAATLGGLLCDALCRRHGPRWGCRIPAMTGLFLTAPLLVAGALTPEPLLAVALLSLSFGCTQITEGAYWAAAISVADRHASVACGVMNTGANVVGGIGALLAPATAAVFGWTVAVMTGALFAIAGMLLWLGIRADRPLLKS